MSGTTTKNGKGRLTSALDLYDNTNTRLKEQYDGTNKQINDSVIRQQQASDANYQRLMKYLPTMNKVNGVTGGLSESSMLEATVAHQNKMADIAAEGEAQKLTAKKEYDQAALAAQKEYDQSVLNAYAENYALASDTIKNWTGSKSDLEAYINGLKESMSDVQYANLQNYAKDVSATIEEQEEEEKELTDNLILGEETQEWIKDGGDKKYDYGSNFYIKYDGQKYGLEVGNEVKDTNAGAFKAVAQGKVTGNNQVFVYGDKLYYTNDGRVFEVYAGGKHYDDVLNAMKGHQTEGVGNSNEKKLIKNVDDFSD
jgi:hypothetical protein